MAIPPTHSARVQGQTIRFGSWDELRAALAALRPLPRPAPPTDASRHVHRLGEQRDPAGLPELFAALGHPSPNVRRLAASALGKIGDRAAVEPLLAFLRWERHPQARQYAVKALGSLGDARAIATLEAIAAEPAEAGYTREAARGSLSALHGR